MAGNQSQLSTVTKDAAWTDIHTNDGTNTVLMGHAYRIVSGGTTDAATWTFSVAPSGGWGATAAAYKEAGPPTPAERVVAPVMAVTF